MKLKTFIIFAFLLITLTGCAYYNTMFNAEKRFETATTKLDESATREVTNDIQKEYLAVIDKCWKLINIHGEDSNYADDALLLIGKSYFQIEDYVKSERFLNQFTLRYKDSNLLSEAYLWLARSLIKLNRDDEAINYLNIIINQDDDDEQMALAWFSLGELEYKREAFTTAIENYKQCAEYTDEDRLAARAIYLVGEIYLEQEDYDQAFENFDDVLDYDVPDEMAFDAQMNKVLSMIKMQEYEISTSILYNMLRDSRFLKYEGVIEARLGDCLVLQDEIENAVEQYDFVMENFPRTEGSSNAAYGLAQLMENYYADVDSAKKLYDRVKQEGYITTERYSDWVTEEGLHNCVINLPNIPADKLVQFCNKARRKFYLRPAYILHKTKQSLVSPAELQRTARAFKTFLKYLFQ